jgi:hypothetical protein
MKTVLFAAALLVGTAAIAQEYPETTVPPDVTTDMPDVSTTPLTTPEAPMTTTMTPTSDSWAASTGTTVAPDNSNPEHDARGIAVISDPAVVPAGFNGTVGAAVGGPLEPVAADASYPPCSRTITDNCTQTYERGRSPN